MHFLEFELEEGDACEFDYLEVSHLHHGTGTGNHTERLCGKIRNSVEYRTRELNLTFVSDTLKQFRGFKVLFTFEEPESCRVVLSERRGEVVFPDPLIQLVRGECVLEFTPRAHSHVLIVFTDFPEQHFREGNLVLTEREERGEIRTDGGVERGIRTFVSTEGPLFLWVTEAPGLAFSLYFYTDLSSGNYLFQWSLLYRQNLFVRFNYEYGY